jgi:hypothetical protein
MSAGAITVHTPRRRGSAPWALTAIVAVLLVALLAGFVGAGGLGGASGDDSPSPRLRDSAPASGDRPVNPGGLGQSRDPGCPQCR